MDQRLQPSPARVAAPPPPGVSRLEGGPGRAVGALVIGALFMGSTLLTPLYDLYRGAFGLSGPTLSLLYAVYVIGNVVALLLLGRLSDQVGRRPVALAGLALAVASALLFLFARQPAALFAGRIVSGLAIGLGSGAASAWLTEFTPAARRPAAAVAITTANYLGIAAGPLLAGVLVQYAPWPLRLPFMVYLGVLAITAALTVARRETVRGRSAVSLRPRLGVPRGIRLAFAGPAVGLFTAMALVGFYAALGPTMIREQLHVANRALSGAVVSELFLVAALTIGLSRRLPGELALRVGLGVAPAGAVLLTLAEETGAFPLLIVATAVCGVAAALAYRGGMEVVNRIAPPDRKSEVVSAYFTCGFLGNCLPVMGVAAVTAAAGARTAHVALAVLLSGLAVAALAVSVLAAGASGRPTP